MQPTAVSAEIVRPLREQVLASAERPELHFPGDEDPETLHAAIILAGRVAAVASVMREPHPHDPLPRDWRVRGMASSPGMRGRGIGAVLLAACETHARQRAGTKLWCYARVRARTLYERAGLVVQGEVLQLEDVGAHYLMSKPLALQETAR